jgi:hypothetical protein
MTRRQVGVTLALVVCSAVLVAVPVMGLGGTVPAQTGNTTNDTTGNFGQQISSFMQASAVDANTTVESGMWQASVNQTVDASGDPGPKVASRTAHLERTLQRLQERTERLQAQRGSIPEVAYTARASALREQVANLKDQINETTHTAARVGVNTSALQRLRTMAGNATGPEVAAVARTITDAPRGPPAGVPGGPPDGAGDGPPDERGGGPPDGAGGGPPDDRGGPPDAANQSNRTNGGEAQRPPTTGENGTGAGDSGDQSPPPKAGGTNRTNGTVGAGEPGNDPDNPGDDTDRPGGGPEEPGGGPDRPGGGPDQPGGGPPDDGGSPGRSANGSSDGKPGS